jgi:polyisoprenyl-phosphate glycosyltransferase
MQSARNISQMTLSIVVPACNERDNVHPLYEQVRQVLDGNGTAFELIFVDDGSSDGTLEAILSLRSRDPRVKAVSLARNFGHQHALTAGIDYAKGDAVLMMDGDLQHPPALIPGMVAKWQEGYDIVYTIREATEAASFLSWATSRGFYAVFSRLAGVPMDANVADFRLIDQKVADAFRSIRERTRFLRALTSWVGFKSFGMPYRANARLAGKSKYRWRRKIRFALDGIASFSTKPLYLGFLLALVFAGLGLAYAAFAVYSRFQQNETAWGWTSIIVLLCLTSALQFVMMGILGIYLGKVYEEVKQRPLYLVRDLVGLSRED